MVCTNVSSNQPDFANTLGRFTNTFRRYPYNLPHGQCVPDVKTLKLLQNIYRSRVLNKPLLPIVDETKLSTVKFICFVSELLYPQQTRCYSDQQSLTSQLKIKSINIMAACLQICGLSLLLTSFHSANSLTYQQVVLLTHV